ncbi:MAG: transcriptional repressor [Clostridia bacterium]|nr:transcriptional repressor [Clostridia bacterium]
MKNYSRQREAILNVLRSTDTHPTAAEVYERVREIIPNISLGTVYRNLDALSASGDILSISVGDGNNHFDGDNSHHLHLNCRFCGKIVDAHFDKTTLDTVAQQKGFTPETLVCVVYGICSDCKNQNN